MNNKTDQSLSTIALNRLSTVGIDMKNHAFWRCCFENQITFKPYYDYTSTIKKHNVKIVNLKSETFIMECPQPALSCEYCSFFL